MVCVRLVQRFLRGILVKHVAWLAIMPVNYYGPAVRCVFEQVQDVGQGSSAMLDY